MMDDFRESKVGKYHRKRFHFGDKDIVGFNIP
jgi:hypothetical protein